MAQAAPPEPPSPYAEEGTAAHALAEDCLRQGRDTIEFLDRKIGEFEVTEEMAEHVQLYLDTVRGEFHPDDGDELTIEHRFSLESLGPPAPMFGTSDAVVYHPKTRVLSVYDLKYGAGIPVEAKGNKQGRYYGLGASLGWNVREVEIIIVQPRAPHKDGPVRRDVVPAMELVDWAADLMEAAEETLRADAPLHAGDWCRFCPARTICPALASKALSVARDEFAEPLVLVQPDQLTLEEIGALLAQADIFESWVGGVRAYAQERLEHGDTVPGWKLVPKRAIRKWKDEEAIPGTLLTIFGFGPEDIYTQKIKSPAQIEKLLKKSQWPRLGPLVLKESSGNKIAPDGDPRLAVAGSLVTDFEALD